ncbi:hypothetical protein DFH11DRAFT_1855207 [Phellopilus nigrolimitatus]|nr:hypothetical protein DFH11DRAFT_1855207 [Phellopilus nigrolimitatus]
MVFRSRHRCVFLSVCLFYVPISSTRIPPPHNVLLPIISSNTNSISILRRAFAWPSITRCTSCRTCGRRARPTFETSDIRASERRIRSAVFLSPTLTEKLSPLSL